MGATSMNRQPGLTTRQVMEAELPNTLTVNGKILASAVVGDVFYAAVQQQPGQHDAGNVWALIVKTYRSRGYFNFTYREMDEGMGTGENTCPDKILDLLSPIPECHHEATYCTTCNAEITDDTGVWMRFANEHEHDRVTGPRCAYFLESERLADGSAPFHTPGGHGHCSAESAREFRAESGAYNGRVRLAKTVKRGTVIRMPRVIEFRSGIKGDTFTYLERNVFLLDGYLRVNLGAGWQARSFEIVEAA